MGCSHERLSPNPNGRPHPKGEWLAHKRHPAPQKSHYVAGALRRVTPPQTTASTPVERPSLEPCAWPRRFWQQGSFPLNACVGPRQNGREGRGDGLGCGVGPGRIKTMSRAGRCAIRGRPTTGRPGSNCGNMPRSTGYQKRATTHGPRLNVPSTHRAEPFLHAHATWRGIKGANPKHL
jgi:hypothetical protein